MLASALRAVRLSAAHLALNPASRRAGTAALRRCVGMGARRGVHGSAAPSVVRGTWTGDDKWGEEDRGVLTTDPSEAVDIVARQCDLPATQLTGCATLLPVLAAPYDPDSGTLQVTIQFTSGCGRTTATIETTVDQRQLPPMFYAGTADRPERINKALRAVPVGTVRESLPKAGVAAYDHVGHQGHEAPSLAQDHAQKIVGQWVWPALPTNRVAQTLFDHQGPRLDLDGGTWTTTVANAAGDTAALWGLPVIKVAARRDRQAALVLPTRSGEASLIIPPVPGLSNEDRAKIGLYAAGITLGGAICPTSFLASLVLGSVGAPETAWAALGALGVSAGSALSAAAMWDKASAVYGDPTGHVQRGRKDDLWDLDWEAAHDARLEQWHVRYTYAELVEEKNDY